MDEFRSLIDLFEQFGQIVILLILISTGYFVGRHREKEHYKSIIGRERYFVKVPAVNIKSALEEGREVEKVELVTGSVVVSADYFKIFVAAIKNLFGGRLTTYESLLDRAKREAILRMKEQARQCDIIINVKVESASISKSNEANNAAVFTAEAIAYGTAITYKKNEIRP
jgi:uncharacterized protein YbjQ (UPF0145 family)